MSTHIHHLVGQSPGRPHGGAGQQDPAGWPSDVLQTTSQVRRSVREHGRARRSVAAPRRPQMAARPSILQDWQRKVAAGDARPWQMEPALARRLPHVVALAQRRRKQRRQAPAGSGAACARGGRWQRRHRRGSALGRRQIYATRASRQLQRRDPGQKVLLVRCGHRPQRCGARRSCGGGPKQGRAYADPKPRVSPKPCQSWRDPCSITR